MYFVVFRGIVRASGTSPHDSRNHVRTSTSGNNAKCNFVPLSLLSKALQVRIGSLISGTLL